MFSFVIPAFNEHDYLATTITKIQTLFHSQHPEQQYEIIVCDNDSSDDTANIALSFNCKVVHCRERSIAKTRNTGAKIASGEWLIFLDADSYPSKKLLQLIVDKCGDDHYIGFGAIVKIMGGKKWFRLVMQSKNWSMKTFNWCLGGFICCRQHAYFDIGGFDESLYAFEEELFIKQLKFQAKRQKQRFKVLNECFYTSGRKSDTLPLLDFIKLSMNIWFNKSKAIRNREKMKYWYKS